MSNKLNHVGELEPTIKPGRRRKVTTVMYLALWEDFSDPNHSLRYDYNANIQFGGNIGLWLNCRLVIKPNGSFTIDKSVATGPYFLIPS